jgi:hypothetical protein
MTFHDFDNIIGNMAYIGHNFSNSYWDMGGGKTVGNRRNTYESYRSSYNPVTEHHWEIDSDFDKSGRFDEFTHKHFCGDRVVLDLSNEKLEEVRLLKRNHVFNGMITTIKKCIPRKTKYEEPRYEIDIRNYDDSISQIYTVPESMLLKIDSKPKKSQTKIDELSGEVQVGINGLSFDSSFPFDDDDFLTPSSILDTDEDIFKSSKILEDIDKSINNIVNDVTDLQSKTTVLEGYIDNSSKEQDEKYKSLDSRVTSLEVTTDKVRRITTDNHFDSCDIASRSQIEEVREKITDVENNQKTVKNIAVASLLSKLMF